MIIIFSDQTNATRPLPKTLPYANTLDEDKNNDILTNKGEDERDDDVAATTVAVETCKITNTAIKSIPTKCEVMDLRNLFTTTKGMPLLYNNDNDNDDDGADDASAVTVATKYLKEGKHNMSAKIPTNFFDIQPVMSTPTSSKKNQRKKSQNHKKKHGKKLWIIQTQLMETTTNEIRTETINQIRLMGIIIPTTVVLLVTITVEIIATTKWTKERSRKCLKVQ